MATPSGRQNAAVAPGAGRDPGRPGARLARLPLDRRAALAHLGRRRRPGGPRACSASTGCPTSAGGGCCSAGCCSSTRSGRMVARRRRGPRCCSPACGPGTYPRGGAVHLRLWLAERLVDELGATSLSSAPLVKVYARLLGCRVGRARRPAQRPAGHRPAHPRHRLLGRARGRPRRALARRRHLHIGAVRVGADARVGARSTLLPGADVGDGAEVAAGSAVFGRGARTARTGRAPRPRSRARPAAPGATTGPPNRRPGWPPTPRRPSMLSLLPIAGRPRRAWPWRSRRCGRRDGIPDAVATALLWLPARDRGRRRRASRCWSSVAVRLLSLGPRGGLPPGARPRRLAGVGDRAAAGRGPHLALPAVLLGAHAGVAAGCSVPRSARTSRSRRCC